MLTSKIRNDFAASQMLSIKENRSYQVLVLTKFSTIMSGRTTTNTYILEILLDLYVYQTYSNNLDQKYKCYRKCVIDRMRCFEMTRAKFLHSFRLKLNQMRTQKRPIVSFPSVAKEYYKNIVTKIVSIRAQKAPSGISIQIHAHGHAHVT